MTFSEGVKFERRRALDIIGQCGADDLAIITATNLIGPPCRLEGFGPEPPDFALGIADERRRIWKIFEDHFRDRDARKTIAAIGGAEPTCTSS